MANDFQRVRSGDDVEIRAAVWNEFLSAAEYVRTQRGSTTTTPAAQDNSTVVWVKNASGGGLNRYCAVGVSGVVCPPDSSDYTAEVSVEFLNNLVLTVRTPTAADKGKWLVLLQPLANGEIGLAVGLGVTQCTVNIATETDLKVDVRASSTVPVSGPEGYDILWVNGGAGSASDTGEQLAVVRMGSSGDSFVLARLTAQDGAFAAWKQVQIDSDGNYVDVSGGLTGTTTTNWAKERSNSTLFYADPSDGDVYLLRRETLTDDSGFAWLFNASLNNPLDPEGSYILIWNPETNSYQWFDPPTDITKDYVFGWIGGDEFFGWIETEPCEDE